MARPKIRHSRNDNNDDSALHWVANLPDDEYWPLLDRLLEQCPKEPITMGMLKKKALYTLLLIPVVQKDGRIPQDAEFQTTMRALDMNARMINKILEGIYDGLRLRRASSA